MPKTITKFDFTESEMMTMLPVILSDLKHRREALRREVSNQNIRRDLYAHVIREMYSTKRFLLNEGLNDGTTRIGLFVKGHIRDVWAYLQMAYDLIHDTDFEALLNNGNVMELRAKADKWLLQEHKGSEDIGMASEFVRGLLRENRAWQRNAARKATAGANLQARHHAEVRELQQRIADFEVKANEMADQQLNDREGVAPHC